MSSLFDKLNLRPQERRLVVIVSIVVFVVLNVWLVFPMFGDYGRYEQRTSDANKKLKQFLDEIAKKPAYLKELKDLESQGNYIPTEEAGLRLSQEVQSQASLSGVNITVINQLTRQPTGSKTNAFFDEAAVTVNFRSGEKELVDFLWRLADKETLVRAKSMQLSTDPPRQTLQGTLTLVKSFQRRPPPKTSAVSPRPAAGPSSAPGTPKPVSAAPATPVPAKPPVTTPVRPPVTSPAKPAVNPIPTPTPAGGTNRTRRALPAPVKP